MAKNLVIVESPAKAKTIENYLGKDYAVLASYGHIRDLPSKKGSVVPDEDFAMRWELNDKAPVRLKEIRAALKPARKLILATDPDREGEAIAWHLHAVLDDALKGKSVERVVFHEITKDAVTRAIASPRELNQDLINAYLARRALDYLVGFSVSPLLWRKVSSAARSAGRVQSVALRLICAREQEIELFRPQEFWSIDAQFANTAGKNFPAKLTHFDNKRLDKFAIPDETQAKQITETCLSQKYRIGKLSKKTVQRSPAPPFTTSTLQQEAARKLGFRTGHTMRVAQKLYEGVRIKGKTTGLISYMRTDSVNMSNEAIAAATALVKSKFGKDYLLDSPRRYKGKVKNAQEAHEAIRPTHFELTPQDLRSTLDPDQLKLYTLIWKRAVATQMANARFEKAGVDIRNEDGSINFRATGSIMIFDGFITLYLESKDDSDDNTKAAPPAEEDDENRILPALDEGDALKTKTITPTQHFTAAPPRYSDASLVKKMEELGIGRPSTYAPIMQVLTHRNYVRLERKRFIPSDVGRVITAFLELYFPEQIGYDFTAHMEESLDEISHGNTGWKLVLKDFWDGLTQLIANVEAVSPMDVSHALDERLAFHYFPTRDGADEESLRRCPTCGNGRLELKTGKFGAFIACNRYPDCRHTVAMSADDGEPALDEEGHALQFPKHLGDDPKTGLAVTLRKGPYGLYLQLGETPPKEPGAKGKKSKKTDAPKPKRSPLPKLVAANRVTLDTALDLLALPREVGIYPETGEMITAGIGPFGPFLKYGNSYVSLKEDDVTAIGINRAVELIAEHQRKRAGTVLGTHPKSGQEIAVRYGRYGYYLQHGETNVALGRKKGANDIELAQAVSLIDAAPPPRAQPVKKAKPAAKKKTKSKK